MSSRFHIANLQPGPYQAALLELTCLLVESLRSLGRECTASDGVEATATNIVLSYQNARREELTDVHRSIAYQLEPLTEEDPRWRPEILQTLAAAHEVWEYNPRNLAYLYGHGFAHAKLVPIGYHPALRRIPRRTEEPINVLFYGSPGPRRHALFTELKRWCENVRFVTAWGSMRDELVSQAKVVLNIHQFERQPFETVRVSYLLNNARCVICEQSDDNPYGDAVVSAPYDELVATCIRYVQDAAERERAAARGFELFEQMPMTRYLADVLNGL